MTKQLTNIQAPITKGAKKHLIRWLPLIIILLFYSINTYSQVIPYVDGYDYPIENKESDDDRNETIDGIKEQSLSEQYLSDVIYMVYPTETAIFWEDCSFKIDPNTFPEIRDLISTYGIIEIENSFYFAKHEQLKRTLRVKLTKTILIDELVKELNRIESIKFAERIPLMSKALTPNDSEYIDQWHLEHIGAEDAWDISTGSGAIDVAVVDDAIQTTHPDLSSSIQGGFDVVDNDNNPNPPDDDYDHGTHVAGIVSATSNNSTGVASIGYGGIDIIPIRASNGSTNNKGQLIISHGYEGITWAAQNGAEIINCSWGGDTQSTINQLVVEDAWNQGCIIVAAAGNDNITTEQFPAAYPNVIAVANSNTADMKSATSNYGFWIDITAPGTFIVSTTINSGYGYKSGTSMASPLTAGLLGLVWSVNTAANRQDVIDCVLNNTTPLSWSGSGNGLINAFQAVDCAKLDPPTLYSPLSTNTTLPVNLTWEGNSSYNYQLQISKENDDWTAEDGFTPSNNCTYDVIVNIDNGNNSTFTWDQNSFDNTYVCQEPLESTQYYWTVRKYDANGSSFFSSPESFTTEISDQITINAPTSSTTWIKDQAFDILWTDNINENVKIDLYKGSVFQYTISNSTASNGSYTHNLINTIAVGSDYRIKISSVSNTSVYDYSDYFAIQNPTPTISVTYPYNGLIWNPGISYMVYWIDNIDENVKIELYKDSSFISTLINSTDSDHQEQITMPTTLTPDTDYSIKVTSVDDNSIFGDSDLFEVVLPNCIPIINITYTLFNGDTDYRQASNLLNASNTIENGAIAEYIAANQIRLTDGFFAEEGSDVHLMITGCSPKTAPITPETNQVSAIKDLIVFPNPTSNEFNIRFELEQADDIEVSIIDIQGRVWGKELNQGIQGVNLFQFDAMNMPKGRYIIKIISSDSFSVQNLIIN